MKSLKVISLAGAMFLMPLLGISCGGDSAPEQNDIVTDHGMPETIVPDIISDKWTPDDGIRDEGAIDTSMDTGNGTDIVKPETTQACSEYPMEFGCECNEPNDCISGWCVLMPDDSRLCSTTCVSDCPEGWICQQVNVGGEPINVCRVYEDPLCNKPCLNDGVCGANTLCVGFESKQYCLRKCDDDSDCNDGLEFPLYECREVTNTAGDQTLKQCYPLSDHCDCPPDTDYMNDVNHCGTCETACAFNHGVPTCNDGECGMGGCEEGWINLNGTKDDGCEYECTYKGPQDIPDDDYVDSNCDGIDGDYENGVFVDVLTGEDEDNYFGDAHHPFKTIGAALIFAQTDDERNDVYVSKGQYREQITLVGGIHLYGGYDAATDWSRNTKINETMVLWDGQETLAVRTIVAKGIQTPTRFDGFYVKTANSTQSSGSSYGMYISQCTGDLVISNNKIEAGNGAEGKSGANGQNGQNGNGGGAGSGSFEYDGCFLCVCNKLSNSEYNQAMNPGYGGSSPCGMTGGTGGEGGKQGDGGYSGNAGLNGGGYGGAGATGDSAPGANGGPGADGIDGSDGDGGDSAGSLDPSGLFLPSSGTNGTDGTAGKGGGGGGGGGGDDSGFLGADCDSAGGAGGGGGGGGCPATAGKAGTGGGGSFGIFLVEASPTIRNNTISSSSGGNGGNGGTGGTGGDGGYGGDGGPEVDDAAGHGGDGGDAGDGGNGGHGGGGAGGPSVAVYILGGSSNPTCQDNDMRNSGFSGSGGLGGAGTSNRGDDGMLATIIGATTNCQ